MANRITNPSPARKERSSMSIGLAGASGSGKSMTAMEIATGLAGPDGRICILDTEGRRALHYARRYKFDHVDFGPPYTPERCAQAIAELQGDKYDVVIFDSASDEYEGEGGMLEMADAEGAWIKTKARHQHSLIRHLRRHPGTVIFCLRADEKVKVEKDQRGKVQFVPKGWMPICEKRFMYDMTLSLTLSPETPGLPRFDLPRKIGIDFKDLFQEGKPIDRAVGERLRAWALDIDAPFVPSGGGEAQASASRPATQSSGGNAEKAADALIAAANKADSEDALLNAHSGETEKKQLAWLKDKRPDLYKKVNDAVAAKLAGLQGGGAPGDQPGGEQSGALL